VGPPLDPTEADRIAWLAPDEVRAVIARGEMQDAPSLIGVLLALAEIGDRAPEPEAGR